MSALAAPFLMRRGSMSYVRVRVPKDLVELVGCSEVRRSLGPLRFHEARLLAARTGSKLKEAFEMMRNANDLTKQEVLNLIRDCFAGLSETYGQPYQPQSTEIDFELAEQQAMADEHMVHTVPPTVPHNRGCRRKSLSLLRNGWETFSPSVSATRPSAGLRKRPPRLALFPEN